MPPDDRSLTPVHAAPEAPAVTFSAPSAAHTEVAQLRAVDWLSMLVREGCRTLLLRAPRWERVTANPMMLVLLSGLLVACAIGVQRIAIDGAAFFYWKAVAGGWVDTIALAWAAYAVQEQRSAADRDRTAPTAAQLLTLMLMQALLVSVLYSAATLLLRGASASPGTVLAWTVTGSWIVAEVWVVVAQARLLLRSATSIARKLMALAALLIGSLGASFALPVQQFWYPAKPAEDNRQLHLSQQTIEAQQRVTAATFASILPQRPGIIDLYGLTFAPYAEESVFRKESALLAEVLDKRFDAGGRTMQLVNHRETYAQFPWATPLNLQRAINRMAALMDREEDILFLHVTSHGARNGTLSADLWPLDVDQITPAALRQWLDAAGVRYRVLSISACYAGAWIEPLSNDDTLVMTASDATHTSYGYGYKSDLTFFGRAMYDEQLRERTLSFEEAFAASREIIRVREVQAGKEDGYSNPQIRTGAGIRKRLAQLRSELTSRKP